MAGGTSERNPRPFLTEGVHVLYVRGNCLTASYVGGNRLAASGHGVKHAHPDPRRGEPADDLNGPSEPREAQQHVEELAGPAGQPEDKREEYVEPNEGAETGENCNEHGGYHAALGSKQKAPWKRPA